MVEASLVERVHSGLIAAFTTAFSDLEGAEIRAHRDYIFLLCPSVPLPQFNGVWVARDGAAAVAGLAAAVREITELRLPFWLQTRAGLHPSVEREAARLGLELVEQTPGMAALAADVTPSSPSSFIDIERVTDGHRLRQALSVAEAGFEATVGTFALFYTERFASVPGVDCYLGCVAGRPVSTAMALRTDDTVGVFNVATLPGCRGRGYAGALSRRAIADVVSGRAGLAILQASEAGGPVYRRLGFRSVSTYNLFTCG